MKNITITDTHTGKSSTLSPRTPILFNAFASKPTIGELGLPLAVGSRVAYPTFSATETYTFRNIVKASDGLVYRCIADNVTTEPPSAEWVLAPLTDVVNPVQISGGA